uniref:Superoxide dismutase n=1 Tax=Kalanchoe fedtschenkoi TaxID=63787 RepID=A0A7N0VGX2_KALFE
MALRSMLTRKALASGLPGEPSVLLGVCLASQSRGVKTVALPDLPYDYGALEPAISGEIMQLHHQKHHQTYVTNYNKALEQLEEAITKGDASATVKLHSSIKFNGGGHINHSIFWKNLTPISEGGGEPPKGSLGWAVDMHFGSLEGLVKKMNAEGAALQGSGWVWLGYDRESQKLVVETTANQVDILFLSWSFYSLDIPRLCV